MSSPEIIKIKQLNLDMINPNSKNYMENKQGGSKIVIIGKPGCFSAGTEILMYNGTIKQVENVKIGDQVMGWDSKPRNVLELCCNVDEMFEITFEKGDKVTVNKEHILTLKCSGYYNEPNEKIIDISVKDFLNKSKDFQSNCKWFKTGVDFMPSEKLPSDPYSVGMKLGRMIDENNEHIPHNYKTSSRKNRLQLLAGLLDTGSYYDNNTYEITQQNKQLLDDIVFVSRSLGFNCYKKEITKVCFNNDNMSKYYRCHISGKGLEEIPTKLNKNQEKQQVQNNDTLVTKFELKSIGTGQYYGFTTDGDHRFLLGDFSVTHNSGKSTLIADILYTKKDIFPVAMAMSGTEDSNGFFKSIMPSTFVYNNYDEEKVIDFIKRQKLAKQHLPNPWAVLIVDDCTDNPAIFRKPTQNSLYKLGRHWKMLYILSLQYSMDVRPSIRTNVDGTFIFREANPKFRKSLYENYAGIIPDYNMFCDIMDQITDDHTALYIHNTAGSNDWKDCVYWYKARVIPSGTLKFGSPDYWAFHEERYNTSYMEPLV